MLDLAFDDVNRLALVLGLVVLLVAVAVVVYLGATACPPPDWAFWRFTGEGRVNFACVA